jgi:hypothetical protein
MRIINFVAPFPHEERLRRLRASVERDRAIWSIDVGPFRVVGNAPITSESGVVRKI